MTDWVERKRTEMYKACIFDLDGTLADTVESIANVANQILERFGAPAYRPGICFLCRGIGVSS